MLIDKQGNFGSIAGLPAAAMRYTEARLSPFAAMLLEDIKLDTVDFVPTYDERHTEPTVLPSKFPNCSSTAPAVSPSAWPPRSRRTTWAKFAAGLIALIDNPNISIQELMQHIPGPDFPAGGIICGKSAIWKGSKPAAVRSSSVPKPRSNNARATATASSSTTFRISKRRPRH